MIKIFGLGFLVALVFGGISAASAFATGPEFYFETSGGVETTIAQTEPFTSTASAPITLSGTAGGLSVELSASSAVATGSLDNFTESGHRGHATGVQIHFTDVTVTKSAALAERCTVHSPGAEDGTVTTKALTGTAVSGPLGVEFTPETGTTFVELEFANKPGKTCPLTSAGPIPVEGSARGTANGDLLEYNGSSGSKLTLGGNPTTFTATFTTESTGHPVRIK